MKQIAGAMTVNVPKLGVLVMSCLLAAALVLATPGTARAEESQTITVTNPADGCSYTITVYYNTSPPSVRSSQDVQCDEPDPSWIIELVRRILVEAVAEPQPEPVPWPEEICLVRGIPCISLKFGT